ncbi:MAG: hypothetical protein JSV82_04610 [Planctomycetota bacterium]|nr:MAG: hypothetical protein JSV82_04610 [Planctomycetota bacterium]
MESKKTKLHTKCFMIIAFLAGSLLSFLTGCDNGARLSPAAEIKLLKQEKTQLQNQIEQFKSENEQVKKQLQVLSGLPSEAGVENLYQLQKIKLTRYTGFYDKDDDGKKEKLIVYIQPIDEEGDIVKATGAVDVQLWDLNRDSGEALLGQWRVEPDELKKSWFATLVIINYRLMFDVADIIEELQEPLTVKVTFTDYMSGKVFTEQKVIKP